MNVPAAGKVKVTGVELQTADSFALGAFQKYGAVPPVSVNCSGSFMPIVGLGWEQVSVEGGGGGGGGRWRGC